MIFTKRLVEILKDPPVQDVRGQTAFYPSSASIRAIDPDLGIERTIGASSGCLRRQYYEITGIPITDYSSPEGELKKEMGGKIQELIEDKLKAAGLWMASEKRIWIPKYKVSGRVDTWAWDPESLRSGQPVPVMIEFKSTGRFSEGGLIRPSKGVLLPKGEHVCQVVPYLDFFSQYPEYFHGERPRVVIFAISRDSMEWKEHVVFLAGKGQYGDDLQNDQRYAVVRNELGTFQLKYITTSGIYRRFMHLARYLRDREIPPRDFMLHYPNEMLDAMADKQMLSKKDRETIVRGKKTDPTGKNPWIQKGDWQCAWCPYKTKCWLGIDHVPKPVIAQDLPTYAEAKQPPVTEPAGGL